MLRIIETRKARRFARIIAELTIVEEVIGEAEERPHYEADPIVSACAHSAMGAPEWHCEGCGLAFRPSA